MSHRLRIPTEVAELIRGLHPRDQEEGACGIAAIVEAPECGKPLKENLAGLRSYRVRRMRIVYRVADDCLAEVVAVGPRKRIYEETYRWGQRENR